MREKVFWLTRKYYDWKHKPLIYNYSCGSKATLCCSSKARRFARRSKAYTPLALRVLQSRTRRASKITQAFIASTLNTPLYLTTNFVCIALAQQLFYIVKHEQLFLICKKTRKSKARTHFLRSKAIPALLRFPAKLG